MDLLKVLQTAVKYGASDIHIVPERPPFLRINGEMQSLDVPPLSKEDTQNIIFGALSEKMVEKFKLENELDTSLSAEGIGRFRLNILEQKDGIVAVLRVIPTDITSPEDIGLDDNLIRLAQAPRGMILVTGPTGSGKSTTLASMINLINRDRKEHILTIEDPIEYVYPKLSCVVTQREICNHSISFRDSLKRALRQDPDIILIGEMRDLETIYRVNNQDFRKFIFNHPESSVQFLYTSLQEMSYRLRLTSEYLTTVYETGKIVGGNYSLSEMTQKILDRLLSDINGSIGGLIIILNPFTDMYDIACQANLVLLDFDNALKIIETHRDQNAIHKLDENMVLSVAIREEKNILGFIMLEKTSDSPTFNIQDEIIVSAVGNQVGLGLLKAYNKQEEEARDRLQRNKMRGF